MLQLLEQGRAVLGGLCGPLGLGHRCHLGSFQVLGEKDSSCPCREQSLLGGWEDVRQRWDIIRAAE